MLEKFKTKQKMRTSKISRDPTEVRVSAWLFLFSAFENETRQFTRCAQLIFIDSVNACQTMKSLSGLLDHQGGLFSLEVTYPVQKLLNYGPYMVNKGMTDRYECKTKLKISAKDTCR